MNIIKLDATASTNTYLRAMLTNCNLENFTTIVTENQFAGKGQRGESWVSEAGSNLTFSVLMKSSPQAVTGVFDLNVMVALRVATTLKKITSLPYFIKWPNDILSANKKVGGILIENIIKANGEVFSVVGIGINVNQLHFPALSKASSLALLQGNNIDKDLLLHALLAELKEGYEELQQENTLALWEKYKAHLYRKDVVSVFQKPEGERFNGIIRNVTAYGKLVIETEDQGELEFALKEVQLLY
ncbi:biotin--[acetyl-CoA-carboxylase] ligase [Myroides fluvii]|uniref:biotin--[acetyl-CoA-carboxylase] ligase n=1 Tax=Myroides fluvii TaxID=2572594 RepID=UPI00131A9AEB|nr:biotin--[acetyl-CoA-carboxylase] ligase [Myroides fluvii]